MRKLEIALTSVILFNSCSFSQDKPQKVTIKPKHTDIKEVYYMQAGKKNGNYSFYYKNKRQVEGNYSHDLKDGTWTFYDGSKNIRIKGNYSDGEKDGEWFYFRDDKLISKLIYNQNTKIDTLKGYRSDGKLAQLKVVDREHSFVLSKKYLGNGNLLEIVSRSDGKLQGKTARYDKFGRKTQEIIYWNDNPISMLESKKSVLFLDYYEGNLENGTGQLINYISGEENGQFYKYIEINLRDSLMDGVYKRYHENGKLLCVGRYKENFLFGEFKFYSNSGELDTIINYELADSLIHDIANGILRRALDDLLIVETMPSFMDEDFQDFRYYVANNLRYPEYSAEHGIDGKVFVQFSVDMTGEVVGVKIVKSVELNLDKEAFRVVNSSPYWEPGFQYFLPVQVQFTFPIVFRLN